MEGVSPLALVNVAILAFATFICWSFWSSRRIIKLYFLALVVFVGLVTAAVGQGLGIGGLIEPANALAIGFAFAGCAAGPTLWREEIRKDLEHAPRLYLPFAPRDLLSWQGLLKLVDRVGPRGAALAYFAPWVVVLGALELTAQPTAPNFDRTYIWIAHAPIAAFALLSAWYVYRSARRLVPGA